MIAAAFCAAVLAVAAAAPAAAALAERPLVYVVVVDGLDGDRVDAGRAPFVSSLLQGSDAHATYYRESRAVMASETNPNHVAMATGAYGGDSGIPANAFAVYHPIAGEDSCAPTGPTDLSRPPFPTSGESATCLNAETMFAAILRQGDPDRLATAAIFGKPKLGRIFAGRTVDPARRDVDHLWAPCSSGADDDDYCGNVPTNPVTGYAIDDATVMDELLRTIDRGVEADGRIKRPDLTLVNLPQVDSAGHAFGTDSGPYDQAIGLADAEIRRLVERLRARAEWTRTVLILLSDHSMESTPSKVTLTSRLTDAGIPAESFTIVQNGGSDFVYLADRAGADRFELLKRMRAAALGGPGVHEALYREPNPADGGEAATIAGAHPGWMLAGERVPDLLVTAEAGTAFSDPTPSSNPLAGNHGGETTRDNFLAVVSGGDGVVAQDLAGTRDARFDDTLANPGQAEEVDVAPTVMGLFGLVAPRDSAGRFLAEAFDWKRLPGFARPAKPALRVRGSRRGARGCSYALDWTPGSVYDLQIRSGRRWGRVRRRLTHASSGFRGRADRRYTVRVRSRAESGVHSRWTARTLAGRGRCL